MVCLRFSGEAVIPLKTSDFPLRFSGSNSSQTPRLTLCRGSCWLGLLLSAVWMLPRGRCSLSAFSSVQHVFEHLQWAAETHTDMFVFLNEPSEWASLELFPPKFRTITFLFQQLTHVKTSFWCCLCVQASESVHSKQFNKVSEGAADETDGTQTHQERKRFNIHYVNKHM